MRQRCVGTSLEHRNGYAAALFALMAFCGAALASAQSTPASDWLKSIPQFPLASSDLTIRQHVESGKPFTVAGQCGAFMGEQNGSFEAWVFPVKLLSHFTDRRCESRDMQYPSTSTPTPLKSRSRPDHTTITYSHITFTVREILFPTRCNSRRRNRRPASSHSFRLSRGDRSH